jgi:hypothetical protein
MICIAHQILPARSNKENEMGGTCGTYGRNYSGLGLGKFGGKL